jgi:hypothetical protein
MIILDATTKKLQIKMGAVATTTQPDFVASYVDITTTTFAPASSNGTLNGSTAVDVVASPAAATQRQVKFISVVNLDTVQQTITVIFNDNATLRTLAKIILPVGYQLEYNSQEFVVKDTNGALVSGGGGVSSFNGRTGTVVPVSGDYTAAQIASGAALTKTDDTNVTLTLGGTPTAALLVAASLTLGWTGTLSVARGGTGAGTFTAHGIMLGEGTGALVPTAAMTDGQLLVGQTGADPLPRTVSGDVTVAASGAITLASTIVAAGPVGDATHVAAVTFDAKGRLTTVSSVAITYTSLTAFSIRDTSAAFDVTLAATSSPILNAGRTLTLNMGNVAHTLAFGTTANTITFPNAASDTVAMLAVGNVFTATQTMPALTMTGTATAGGATMLSATPGAHTAVVAEVIDYSLLAHTITITGNYTNQRFLNIAQPTITAGAAQTITSATTMAIAGPPIAAGSAVLTNVSMLVLGATNSSGAGLMVSKNTGTTSPLTASNVHLHAIGADGVGARLVVDCYNNAVAVNSGLILRTSRGTMAAPTAVLLGDELGQVSWAGNDGNYGSNSSIIGAYIKGEAEENWDGTHHKASLDFAVADSDGTLSRIIIWGSSGVGIATGDVQPGALLDIGKVGAGATIGLVGGTSGRLTLAVAAAAGANTLTFPAGTTDFSATGGTSRVVRQSTAGGAFTVATLASTELSDTAGIAYLASANLFTLANEIRVTDAVTNATSSTLTVSHDSSGTPAANFGVSILMHLASSTTVDQGAGRLQTLWTDATHATRTSAFDIALVNSAAAIASVARFFASGGFSVNSTTDPGAGIINANTGFRIANVALASTNLSDTASIVLLTSTQSLTNKAIVPRTTTTASTATLTMNADAVDVALITAQAAALVIANPTGTPTDGQKLIVRVIDNGTARAITYGTQFASTTVTLPTTTVISTTLHIGFMYDSVGPKWRCIATA